MTTTLRHSTRAAVSRSCLVAAWIGLASSAALAAPGAPSSEIQTRYEQERARCMNGSSNQDRTTCLKEAGAARDEAMRNRLDDGSANHKRDAMERCKALAGDEAKDCRARVKGAGTTSGSVESGGVFRETVTPNVKPMPVSPSASSAR